MDFRIFYSWQSDLPNATNRSFVQDALERAATNLARDDTVEVEPVVDRDTQGRAGSPSIDQVIFEKIERSQAFVADISIINGEADGRKTPNPNVLLELGYAARALSWDRVVLVFNLATGDPRVDLPFDLRQKRRIVYTAIKGESDRSEAKKALIDSLDDAIREMIAHESQRPSPVPATSLLDVAVEAVESQVPVRSSKVRQYLDWLFQQLDALSPAWNDQSELDDQLMAAIDSTPALVCGFAQLCQTIAQADDRQGVNELHRFFEQVLTRYDLPPRFSGGSNVWQFDFWKFMGHELLVSCVQHLLAERRWELLGDLLDRGFYSERVMERRNDPVQSFIHFSAHLRLLEQRRKRLGLNWITLHGQTLIERHDENGPVACVPLAGFKEAEMYLFCKGEVLGERSDDWANWIPWTSLYYRSVPRFISDSRRSSVAEQVAASLGAVSVDAMKKRLKDRIPFLATLWHEALSYDLPFDLKLIDDMGSR